MTVKLDTVTLEVIRNALPAVANEMAADLQRTSYNMMIYEVRDYCTALLDTKGELISQNVGGVSHFVADLGVLVTDGMARYGSDGFAPGDVIITNHQAVAGQHLNNVVVYMPYFYQGELLMFLMVRAHWIDVGGTSTGFGAGATVSDPWLEGLQLDQLKIYEAGKLNDTLYRVIKDNIRFPESSLGDMKSQMAACRLAGRRLDELFGKYGRDTMLAAISQIFDETEQKCRNVVAQLKDGTYEASASIDDDGVLKGEEVPIHVKVIVAGGDMTIDLSGCSPERKAAINSRTYAGARVAYKALTGPLDPVNEGSFRALKVIIPEGNIMMARFPAPMAGWSSIVPTVVDAIVRALAGAMPDRVPAGHHGLLGGAVVFFGTHPKTRRRFVVQSIEGGGWGGRPFEDGVSGTVSVCQGDVRNGSIEGIELK
jgi:N-methylhydantoinase B